MTQQASYNFTLMVVVYMPNASPKSATTRVTGVACATNSASVILLSFHLVELNLSNSIMNHQKAITLTRFVLLVEYMGALATMAVQSILVACDPAKF
jgi:hypothetical protein